jgi:hypothetical protein
MFPVRYEHNLREMWRISHCLDNRVRDEGKFVSFTRRPHSTPEKHFPASGTNFR